MGPEAWPEGHPEREQCVPDVDAVVAHGPAWPEGLLVHELLRLQAVENKMRGQDPCQRCSKRTGPKAWPEGH